MNHITIDIKLGADSWRSVGNSLRALRLLLPNSEVTVREDGIGVALNDALEND